jgi:hypothetical protein
VQCDQIDQSSLPISGENYENKKKIGDAFGKLKTMLKELNINPSHILP